MTDGTPWPAPRRPNSGIRSPRSSQLTVVSKPTMLGSLANKYGLEPVHFAMERKMLLGIKERVEQAAAP